MMSVPIDPETSVLRHPVATQHVAGRGDTIDRRARLGGLLSDY